MDALEYAKVGLIDRLRNGESCDSCHYLLGICYLKERRWDDAEVEFLNIKRNALKEKAMLKLDLVSQQSYKSPKVALWLSTFIPGAGQIYSGKPFQGVVSLSLNVSLGYLTYRAIRDDRDMDAFLILYFGLQRFYFGNLRQAQQFSAQHNERLINDISVD
jgi:TM2 domain-containing membrane protein YozV